MKKRPRADLRWACLLFLLPVSILALACGDGESADGRREITANDLASLMLTKEDVSQALGTSINEVESRADLGQEFEGIDLQKYGLVSGYVALYRGEATAAGYTLALFDTPDGASSTLQDLVKGLDRDAKQRFNVDIGDDAQGFVFQRTADEPGVFFVALGINRVVASVVVLQAGNEDMRDDALQLAKALADKLKDKGSR